MFGCLERQGITRQTITAVARVHVELLVINSNQFHSLIVQFPNLMEGLQQTNYFHNEYVESKRKVYFEEEPSHGRLFSTTSMVTSFLRKMYDKTKILIKPDDWWHKIWNYIVCVHVASVSSIVFMFYVVMLKPKAVVHFLVKIAIYLLDAVFIVKIYFSFHLAYVENESGIVITDHHRIRMRYLKSWKFWMDIAMCFPFEVIGSFMTEEAQILRYCLANRMFRFIYLIQYYNNCQEKLTVRTHLRWTFLIYWICINLQFMTCIWWLAACLDGTCYSTKSTNRKDRITFVKTQAGLESTLLAYGFVINLLTGTGFQDVKPMNMVELLVTMVIICVLQFHSIALASEFATMLAIGQFTMGQYEYNIHQLRTYLKGRKLSRPIVDKVWEYSLQLWKRQRGEWMPAIVTEAPDYLKQDLMTALFGHHLHKHFLFCDTHTDFLRQLVVHLRRCVFFPGNYLAEKGDMDGSMYFIHDGEVEALEKHNNTEIARKLVRRNNSFGEAQGLFNVPHDMSYKARTIVDALILRGVDWKYLLEWFPASKETIFDKAMQYHLEGSQKVPEEMRGKTPESSDSYMFNDSF